MKPSPAARASLHRCLTLGCALLLVVWVLPAGCPPQPGPGSPNDNSQTDPSANDNDNDNGGDPGTNDNTNDNSGTGNDNANDNDNDNDNDNGGGGVGGGDDPDPPIDTPSIPVPTSITLQAIATTGDTTPVGGTFTEFGTPIIDATGRVAFIAKYEGLAASNSGLFLWDATNGLQVVHYNDPATAGIVPNRPNAYFGRPTTVTSYDPFEFEIAFAAGDRLLFAAAVDDDTDTVGVYRYRATDGDIVRVIEREQVAPFFDDTETRLFDADFPSFAVSDAGQAVIICDYFYLKTDISSGFSEDGIGVYTSNGTTVEPVADTILSERSPGDVPDQDANAYFDGIVNQTTMDPSGDALFGATYRQGDGRRGLYLARSGTPYRAIDSRDGVTWSGLEASKTIAYSPAGSFERFAIGPNGHIATATNSELGTNTENVVMIWDWDTAEWSIVAASAETVVTTLVTGVNEDGEVVVVSDNVPFLATASQQTALDTTLPPELTAGTLVWSETDGAINNQGRALLAYTVDGSPGLVFWTGDEFLVVADANADVPAGLDQLFITSGPQRNRPGRSGPVNDDDQAVFHAVFADTSETIYLSEAD